VLVLRSKKIKNKNYYTPNNWAKIDKLNKQVRTFIRQAKS